ncbi:uncharacterized protein FOMMEDRAFT_154861 [Fomitiporia mediterranea MF3/22]|uniref:uncharacterized protein n=1 Tax=Fomitiporia mediterranea (strain MF3/22) TaxID=694068 RepID=UPI0004408146|nr:uncharacterized protein FOMMEDRAFT_154861 [Fomitiporia mediterranea MF3/22]EJD03756.1 hypothetical protein FOMMEDRAFT_154861 [Fomitiporia mediterranea MF3/22]
MSTAIANPPHLAILYGSPEISPNLVARTGHPHRDQKGFRIPFDNQHGVMPAAVVLVQVPVSR